MVDKSLVMAVVTAKRFVFNDSAGRRHSIARGTAVKVPAAWIDRYASALKLKTEPTEPTEPKESSGKDEDPPKEGK